MATNILVNVRPGETRVAIVDNGVLTEYMSESNKTRGCAGSIFKGKVVRILPGMQAAFVDIGLGKAAFLYVGDVLGNSEFQSRIFLKEDLKEEQEELPEGEDVVIQDTNEIVEKTPIQDLISDGQDLLVQVAKDPLGTKGARITTFISLPGRFVVFMPTVDHIGISRRIEDVEERERLKNIIEKLKPEKGGIIVRTAGEGATEEQIKSDLEYLDLSYKEILGVYNKRKTTGLIHTELDVELRAIRDLLGSSVKNVIVDDLSVHKKISKFISQFLPRMNIEVEYHSGDESLFDVYGIDLEISRALGRKIWLKSGGYIIIDEAEALVVIDVNTGSYVGKRDLEDTILKTNLEAVKEIAYQLKIRNVGGIIIIDFIDMERDVNREKVLNALREEFKQDRAKTNVISMSPLGLVELTRKRTRPSLIRTLCEPCSYCDGKGYIKSKITISHDIFREIEREGAGRVGLTVIVHCHQDIANWIYDEESELLDYLENKFKLKIVIKIEPGYHIEQYDVYST